MYKGLDEWICRRSVFDVKVKEACGSNTVNKHKVAQHIGGEPAFLLVLSVWL